jgi:hypothetical protein
MSRTRVSMTVLFSSVGVGLLNLLFTTVVSSDKRLDSGNEFARTAQALSQAEMLDSISLDRPVHFVTPDVTETVADDEQITHVVLLLPDGTGLEAVGSYDVIRSRGMRTVQLTPIQILSALKKKLQKKGN